MDWLVKLIDLLQKRPMTVFVVLSIAFGYAYWVRTARYQALLIEVGGLRKETQNMTEIIRLKVEKECKCTH